MDDHSATFCRGFLVGAILSMFLTAHLVRGACNAEAIERGYGMHNVKTGAWEWVISEPERDSLTTKE